jgi:DNA-binding protein HU-beta
MNKQDLVDAIAAKAEVTKKEAETVLNTIVDTIMETVSSGEKVTLVGFGTFEARHRKAREGRNPATGKTIQIPETTVPAFSAGKLFKEKVAPAEGAKGKKK